MGEHSRGIVIVRNFVGEELLSGSVPFPPLEFPARSPPPPPPPPLGSRLSRDTRGQKRNCALVAETIYVDQSPRNSEPGIATAAK